MSSEASLSHEVEQKAPMSAHLTNSPTVSASSVKSYTYSPLNRPHHIRLLRLAPNADEKATITGQLFDYELRQSSSDRHLYEALSYVWGGQDKSHNISVDGASFSVTRNCFQALQRLRDCAIERILWIDAICINQSDLDECGQQVRYMAEIYCKARTVLVWLGEATASSDRAFEAILYAAQREEASKRLSSSLQSSRSTRRRSEKHLFPGDEDMLSLFKRPYFERVWVLQEIAAAQDILLICGSKTINGFTFALGLRPFSLDEGPSSMRTVTPLIRGSIFRPQYSIGAANEVSLDIRPLGELLDMYLGHKASVDLDKLYALLGMSSDDPSSHGLQPDYHVSWDEAVGRLTKYLLGEQTFVKPWADRRLSVISVEGYVYGKVISATPHPIQEDQQVVYFSACRPFPDSVGDENKKENWPLQASAKSVQPGDLICLIRETAKYIIIRPARDFFFVIMIFCDPPRSAMESNSASTSLQLEGGSDKVNPVLQHFLLTWDWEDSLTGAHGQELIKDTLVGLNGCDLDALSDKYVRFRHAASILVSGKELDKAEELILFVNDEHEKEFGGPDLCALRIMDALIPEARLAEITTPRLMNFIMDARMGYPEEDCHTVAVWRNLQKIYLHHLDMLKVILGDDWSSGSEEKLKARIGHQGEFYTMSESQMWETLRRRRQR